MLHDFNANENHLRGQRGGAGWSGVGRLANDHDLPLLVGDQGEVYQGGSMPAPTDEYVAFEDVTSSDAPALTHQTLQLPQFNFATGVSSCDCPSDVAGKVAAANAAAVVTPMPDAPKQINWLLILGAAGLGYFFLKDNPKPALGTLEPAPAVQDLGRPASKPKAKPKHVAHLSI